MIIGALVMKFNRRIENVILIPIPIPREAKRGARLKCVYCRKKGATGISFTHVVIGVTISYL